MLSLQRVRKRAKDRSENILLSVSPVISDLLLQRTLTNVTGLGEIIAKADLLDSIKKNVGKSKSKRLIIAAMQKLVRMISRRSRKQLPNRPSQAKSVK